MAIAAINSLQSTGYKSTGSVTAADQQAGAGSQSVAGSNNDSFEMSSAAQGKSASQCKKGKSTCDGCGACQSSATAGIAGSQATNADYTTLNAANAYESQSKYI